MLWRQGLYLWKSRPGIRCLMKETHLSNRPLMFHACALDRCRFFFFFLGPVKFGETQTSGRLLLMNVKSKADLFRKSKHFHTYDRAISRVRHNHRRHLISCLCSCCQLCASDKTKLWFGVIYDKCRMYEADGFQFKVSQPFPKFLDLSYHHKLFPLGNVSFVTEPSIFKWECDYLNSVLFIYYYYFQSEVTLNAKM